MHLPHDQRIVASFFSGPNGMGTGLFYAGWHGTDYIEFDNAACTTIKRNHQGTLSYKIHNQDIRTAQASDLTHTYYPVMTYTWPCTNYSNMAAVHGHQVGDDLYLHALRMHHLLYPEVAIIENVLGMRKFPVVMELLRKYRGYHKTEFTVYGHDFTMQQKARCFLILHRQSFVFPSLESMVRQYPIPIPGYIGTYPGQTLADYLDPVGTPFDMQPSFEARVQGEYQRAPVISYAEQTTPVPLTTNYQRDRSGHLVWDAHLQKHRAFTVEELARLHGFPKEYTFSGGKNDRYKQVVDSVMPPVAYMLGMMINQYFESIPTLAEPLDQCTYTFVQSVDPRRRKEDEVSEYTPYHPDVTVEPIAVGIEQLSLI